MEYVMMLVTFVPLVLILVIIPYVTRRTESFGVSIPADVYHNNELRMMRQTYAWLTALFGIVIMAFLVVLSISGVQVWDVGFPIALIVFFIGNFIMYLIFHFRMKSLKANQNWSNARSEAIAVDTEFRKKKITYSNGWFVIPFVIMLATLVMTFLFYGQIPGKMPTHFDLQGNVNGWTYKSYRSVLMMPLLQLFMTAVFLFINVIIGRAKQQIDVAHPDESVEKNIKFRRRWSGFMIVMGTVLVAQFFVIQLSLVVPMDQAVLMTINLVVFVLIIGGTILLAFTTGQGGSRLKKVKGKGNNRIDRDDDRYWKLGQFYFNPNDPAIWVEKRFGIGWTVNFAHPAGWGSIVAILVIVVFIEVFTS